MLLCEEYASRMNLRGPSVSYASITHAFFGNNRRLTIRWMSQGFHPGFFEISEFKIGSQSPLYISNVQWNEYENHILKWVKSNDAVVVDRSEIFKIAWAHFLSVNDSALAEKYDPKEIYLTFKSSAPVVAITEILEKIAVCTPRLYDFWNSRCMEMVSNYGYWLRDLKA